MSLRRYLVFALVLAAAWWMFRPAAPAAWTGRPAPTEPRPTAADLPAPWKQGDYSFTPLARFDVQAVVLSRVC